MPLVDVVRETTLSRSARSRQLESAFDVPPNEKCRLEWKGAIACEEREWNVGLIVGPSGSGKSTIMRECFGKERALEWRGASVLDDFDAELPLERIADACMSVGFNTIPAWLRPYGVLSNGEQFRAQIARRLLETPAGEAIIVDEFTSVVDRQVAKIASHAVQKLIRREKRQLIVATCHYDVIDWLQPDWIFEPATMSFTWRSLRRRPELAGEIQRVDYPAWQLFAPFHYMSADLNRTAACFVLFVDGVPASFAGMLNRPHPTAHDIVGLSRIVTLPDFQGLGLAFILSDALGAAYKTVGKRMHTYPVHPALVHGYDRSRMWALKKKPGVFSPVMGKSSTLGHLADGDRAGRRTAAEGGFGGRPCAVFEYAGPTMTREQAVQLLDGHLMGKKTGDVGKTAARMARLQ